MPCHLYGIPSGKLLFRPGQNRARDDPAQVAKARKRMIEIVIGLVVWILSAVTINLLIPGSNDAMKKLGTGGVIVTRIQL